MDLCERFSRNPPTARPLRQRGDGPETVMIGPGSACQGDISGVGQPDERPVRVVEFARPFAIGRYEVTFDETTSLPGDGVSATCRIMRAGGAVVGR